MTEATWPSPTHNSRAVADDEYEQLVSPYVASALVGKPSDTAVVYADGAARVVKIRAGKSAEVRGRLWSSGTTDYSKNVAANGSASPRYDLVVLRLDRSTWAITAEVVTGTPGSGVPSPTQNTGTTGVFELPIASVHVKPGATVIEGTDITWLGWYLAPQDIVCTSTTRPNHQPARRIYETDTGNEYVSDGANWINRSENTGWVQFSAATGWTKSVARVCRINGAIYAQLKVIRSGDDLPAGTDSVMGILPSTFRPSGEDVIMIGYYDGANEARALISADGKITLANYDAIITTGSGTSAKLAQGGPFPKGSTFSGQSTSFPLG